METLKKAESFIRSRIKDIPATGVVLGSGLGEFAESLEQSITIPYSEIPGFKKVTVKGHAGNLICGKVNGVSLMVLQGRYHYYEGHDMKDVVFPVKLLCYLGVKNMIITNAAGGIREDLKPGSLMIISDHINLLGNNPLKGENEDELGPRFPDMSEVYSGSIADAIECSMKENCVPVHRGVYAAMTGPSYETPAEIRMLGAMGADAVGMSTVPEAIVCSHMGVKAGGISCITNSAAGISKTPLSHTEVTETANRVKKDFINILKKAVINL